MKTFIEDPIFDEYMEKLGYKKLTNNTDNPFIQCIYQHDTIDISISIGYRRDNGNLTARLSLGRYLPTVSPKDATGLYRYILDYIAGPKIAFKYIKEKQLEELTKSKKCNICGSELRFSHSFKHSDYWVYNFICDNCKNTIYNTYDIDKNTGLPKLKTEEDKNERLF